MGNKRCVRTSTASGSASVEVLTSLMGVADQRLPPRLAAHASQRRKRPADVSARPAHHKLLSMTDVAEVMDAALPQPGKRGPCRIPLQLDLSQIAQDRRFYPDCMLTSGHNPPDCPKCGQTTQYAQRLWRWPHDDLDIFQCEPCDASVLIPAKKNSKLIPSDKNSN